MSVHPQVGQSSPNRKPVSLATLRKAKESGEKLTMLTCYDYSFAKAMDAAGVDMLLIGDSLGMVVQGHDSTLPVTLEDIAYHTACVAKAKPAAIVVADMPWGSYQVSPEQAYESASQLMAVGAQMVKLEGGAWLAPTVRFLTERGIPVCAHLGLTPQSVHTLSGYKVQGRGAAGDQLIADAKALQDAGAAVVLVELIPTPLGRRLEESLHVPTIGIGAGPHTTGQVLVLHDILDVTPGKKARFVKNYLNQAGSVQGAFAAFVQEVRTGAYPQPEHGFAE